MPNRDNSTLLAFPETSAEGRDGRLIVGPEALLALLPGGAWRAAFGPYWVIYVSESSGHR